jgi:hypothetical protein
LILILLKKLCKKISSIATIVKSIPKMSLDIFTHECQITK